MIETPFFLGGTPLTRFSCSDKPSPESLVLFPGFPGYAPAPGILNYKGFPKLRLEIAKFIVPTLGMDVYLPGYEGLGESDKKFRFDYCVRRGMELTSEIIARGHQRLHVGGHSWGAFVAFNAHCALGNKAGKLALLSGLLDLDSKEAVRGFLPYYITHFPNILGNTPEDLERAVEDLDGARRAYNPLNLVKPFSKKDLLIVHGRQDTEVSIELSRRFYERAGGRYAELDADHGYTGRLPWVSAEILRFIGEMPQSCNMESN